MKSNTKSISLVMIIMIFSRLFSLLSVQIYMAFFGTTDAYINIYSYAISLPNIIFTCIGTALSTVIIPIFSGKIANNDIEGSKRFSNNIITITILLTAILILIGISVAPFLVRFTDFKNNSDTYNYAVMAIMIMMPAMFFYGLNYIFQGMLQSLEKFLLPAFVSLPSSFIVIIYVITLGDKFGVTGLLVATLIGLSMQAFILIPSINKSGYRYHPLIKLDDPDIKLAIKMALPVLIGVSAYQINMFFNITFMAKFENTVTMLTYIQNIVLNLVLSFIYSITAVIYPKLTKYVAVGDMDGYKTTLKSVLSSIIFFLVPITLGFIGIRTQLLNLIARWGKVGEEEIAFGAMLLSLYAIGIIGIGLKEVLDRAFYSISDTKTSAINGFIIMLINITLSFILIKILREAGIVIAYSTASLVGGLLLLFKLRKKIGPYASGLWLIFFKCLTAGIIMFGVVLLTNYYLTNLSIGGSVLTRLVKLLIPVATGAVSYFIVCIALKVEEIKPIISKLRRKEL